MNQRAGRGSNDKMESYDGDETKPLVRSGWSSRTEAREKIGKGVVEKAAKDKVMMKGRGSTSVYDLEGNAAGGTQNSGLSEAGMSAWKWKRPARPESDGDRCVAWHIQNGKDAEGGGCDVFGDVKEEDPEAIEKDKQEKCDSQGRGR